MQAYLGMIVLFPYTFLPKGWAECNGQVLRIFDNMALYAAIGPVFGGDGADTFALPKMEHPPHMKYCICTEGIFPNNEAPSFDLKSIGL